MRETARSTQPEDRVYARIEVRRPFLAAAAQRATRSLARRGTSARDLSELATWEGEGGALRPRIARYRPSPSQPSMRFAMSMRPAYDSPGRADVELAASVRGKAAPMVAGERKAGPPQRLRWQQNAPGARPMNTRRGGRSR